MDWNWLFSSVAQSVASLVGVLGAFLISRIINSEAAFATNRARTHELIRRSERFRDRAAARYFTWFNAHTLEDGLRGVQDWVDENGSATPEELYELMSFSPYLPKDEVLPQIREAIEQGMKRRYRRAMSKVNPANFPAPYVGVNTRPEREAIDQLIVEIKSHTREVRAHLDLIESNPERSVSVPVVLVALLVLFWTGVMYPLSLLPVPAPTNSAPLLMLGAVVPPKAVVLIVVGLVFTLLIAALWVVHLRLSHKQEDVDSLNCWLDAASYSPYLGVRVANGLPL